jgi:hypothetical protein
MFHAFTHLKRAAVTAAMLSIGLLGGPLLSGHAAAGLITCGTDPQIVLSNGKVVNMAVTINDQASDVQNISFVLHGPAGTSVTSIAGDNNFAGLESFQYYPDGSSSYAYVSDILVTTGASTTATATTTLTNQSGSARTMTSLTGNTGQHLVAHLFMWG